MAAVFVWDGGGNNANWSTANNWNPNGAPSAGTLNDYTFGTNNRLNSTATGATAWEVNSITFDNTAALFVLGGTAFNLQAGGVTNNDTQTQTINNAIALQATATLNANSGSLAMGGVISGAFGLTTTGANTVTLSGANTYTGATTVNAGTLKAGVASVANTSGAFGNNSAVTLANVAGATLDITGFNTQIGSLTGGGATGGNVTLGTATLTVGGDNTSPAAFAGAISGTGGSLTKIGTGTLTLSGTNTYTGTTTVSAGALAYGASNALASGNVTVSGGTLAMGTFSDTVGTVSLTSGSITGSTGVLTGTSYDMQSGSVSAILGGSGVALTKTTSGTVTLSGTNTYTGVTTVNAGTLSVGSIGNGGVAGNLGQATNAAGNLVLGGGTLQYTGGTASTDRNFTLTTGTTSTIDVSTGATNLTISGSSTATTGALTKAGTGTLTLSGTNTYTGTTTVSAGTLLANGSASLGDTTGNVTVSAGTLALAGGAAVTAGSPTNAQTITKSGMLTLSGSGASGTTGALHATGSTGQTSQWIGNITLSGNATISAADNLLIIGNGAYSNTLNLNANTLTFNTTAAASVTPIYQPTPAFILDPTNILFNSAISGSGGIVKNGTGTLTLISYPSNSYTGTTVINDGKLIIGGPNNLPVISSTSVTVGDGSGAANSAVLQMGFLASGAAAKNYQIGTASGSSATTSMTVNSDGLFNLNGGNNALVNLTLAGGHVDMGAGYSNLLTLTGSLTTTASAQTALVEHGNLGLSANSFTINVADGGAATDLQIDSIIQNGIGYTGGTSGTSLAKAGTGTLVLTGANTYDGITDVQAGVLNIQHNSALGQNTAGTLVQAGAQLQLDGGGGAGNLTITGETLTLNGNGTSTSGELRNVRGNNTYNGFITLGGDSRINADTGTTMTLASASGTGATIINGSAAGRTLTVGGVGNININSVIGSNVGTLVKDGTGTVTLAGDYSPHATTTVKDGTLALNMGAGGLNAASATVTIGDGVGSANSATLLLSQSNQIADTATLTLGSDGRFNVNGNSETIGSIGGTGSIVLGTGQLTTGGNNASTTFSGKLSGGAASSLTKAGSGTLTISSNVNGGADGDFLGTLNLNAGTLALLNATNTFSGTLNVAAGSYLKLTDATLNVDTLNFTGSGSITLDFSGTASILNVTNNLTIAAGITLNIINWQNAADYFYAANWTGATLGTIGTGVETQVIFNSPTYTGANTKWQTYDHQITPAPEPSTYGELLLGAMGALLGWRRYRKTKPAVRT